MTSETKIALLSDRGVIALAGPDAVKLLQGLVTNDLALLDKAKAVHAGLLSPQGKILFDFFIVKSAEGLLLEVARDRATDLVKRLSLYKLRADVSIADDSEAHQVAVAFGLAPRLGIGLAFADPRLAELGCRAIIERATPVQTNASEAEYHALRVALGVPQGGRDYPLGDTFPHEALFDRLHGVSFTKGCYVGQEVVSRMEHRGTARRRVVPLAGGAPLRSGTPVMAGDVEIGTIGSVAGTRALALLRLDRAEEAKSKGIALAADGAPVRIELPSWWKVSVASQP